MASSFTTNKHIEKPAHNDYVDTWEIPVNGNSNVIDAALGSTTNLSVTGMSGTIALATADYQSLVLSITGTLTANVTYQVPSGVGGFWIVRNATTGAFNVVISSGGGGTTITTVQGGTSILYIRAGNVAQAVNQSQISAAMAPVVAALTVLDAFNQIAASGGTITGNLSVTGNESIGGTLGVTGTTTLSGAVNVAANSASSLVATDGSKNLTSIAPGTAGQALVSTGSAWAAGLPAGLLRAGTSLVVNPYVLTSGPAQAHGLGGYPSFVEVYLECLSSELNYNVGDRVSINASNLGQPTVSAAPQGAFAVTYETVNVIVTTGTFAPELPDRITTSFSQITPGKWKLVATPYKVST